MHDQKWHNLEDSVAELDDAEKLELIEQLARSLRTTQNGENQVDVIERQHQAFRRLQETIAAASPSMDPHAQMGYSNEAHDKILYDLEQK